jgi:hypothetical protein
MPPLLELVQSKKVTATVTLEQSTAELVDRYAQYVTGGADEVVDKALNYVFSKDKDFQRFVEENKGDPKPTQPLRCKPIESVPKGRPGRKPGNASPTQS